MNVYVTIFANLITFCSHISTIYTSMQLYIPYYLVPTVRVDLSPPLLNGNSGEDALELLCTAAIAEDVAASYQFAWIKDDISIYLPNDRIVVCIHTYV